MNLYRNAAIVLSLVLVSVSSLTAKVANGTINDLTGSLLSTLPPMHTIPEEPTVSRPSWAHQIIDGDTRKLAIRIASDSNGNWYVAGLVTTDPLPGRSVSLPYRRLFVRKYDESGSEVWTKEFPEPTSRVSNADMQAALYDMLVYALTVNRAGEVYVAGQMASQGFIVKYDTAGNIVWRKFFDTISSAVTEVACDNAGNLYVAGAVLGNMPGITQGGGGYHKGFIQKYSAEGIELWTRQFTGGASESSIDPKRGVRMVLDSSGNIYMGASELNDERGNRRAFVLKYDASGTAVWTIDFPPTMWAAVVNALAVDNLGGLYVGIGPWASWGYQYIVKYSAANGNEVWSKKDNNLSVAGIQAGPSGSVYTIRGERTLRHYTSAGDIVDDRTLHPMEGAINTSSIILGRDLAVDGAGNIAVIGNTQADTGERDGFIIVNQRPSESLLGRLHGSSRLR